MLDKIFILFNTIRYLRFKQIKYRLLYRFIKPKYKKINELPKFNKLTLFKNSYLQQSIFKNETACFLNQTHDISTSRIWNDTNLDKLWLYNLHYFDDLNAEDCINRESLHWGLLERWISENPFGEGNGWEPYTLSLRIVNWLKWLSAKKHVDEKYLRSLQEQIQALTQQIEYHILGNHVFANAKALVFYGVYMESEFADAILKKGLDLLSSELDEQFLQDGAHFELSPMYHCILLWDILELINLVQISKNKSLTLHLDKWKKKAKKALFWLDTMLHPDGEISFFNDAAIGIAPSPQRIFDYATTLKVDFERSNNAVISNIQSGYSRVIKKHFNIIFDHANVGPDFLPGHAHADTLSFEMSMGEQRVFVNSGTSLYGVSKERLRQRQTAAHNTVVVEKMESSEVWSGFRVARRAYAKLESVVETSSSVLFKASHDGYMRLKPPVKHTRSIECRESTISIVDELSVAANACFHLHLHPLVVVSNSDVSSLNLKLPNGGLISVKSNGKIEVVTTTWHPHFGASIKSKKAVISFNTKKLETIITVIKAPL